MKRSHHADILSIQYLRGIAALMVVLFHVSREVRPILGAHVLAWGEFGVDIFFIISGFVMIYSVSRANATPSPYLFMEKRLVRIAPMYWLMSVLMVIGLIIRPGIFNSAVLDTGHVIQSLLFIPHFHPGIPQAIMPMLVPGWTLTYEIYFYLLFALFISSGSIGRFVLPSTAIIVISVIAVHLLPGEGAIARFLSNPIALEFVLGMAVGLAYLKGWLASRRIAPFAAFAAFALIVFCSSVDSRLWTAGAFSALLVYFAVSSSIKVRPGMHLLLQALGDSSYSLYLSHIFVIGMTTMIWKRVGITAANSSYLSATSYILLCTILSVIIGFVVFRYVERPITGIARSLLAARRERYSAVVTGRS
ncbi:acyltransferase family protein [Sphingobium chungbukense]|uniref:Acyltransferase 3 domain-containing protein n=1 Tax=Sphingobium chungbukense TaxID=56193 RepID=A0A0M3APT1_9SPHN|nr:acyltransferase [Sphingobium chungbukense]KKW90549.1 hypothetical protein YP76_18310 [Sphingobium chungbukense]